MDDGQGYEFIYLARCEASFAKNSPALGGFSDKDVIALEKRPIKNGDQTIEFVVERKPTFVGVDPYLKLISRNTSNNVKRLGSKAGS
jgi:hypothetical protein